MTKILTIIVKVREETLDHRHTNWDTTETPTAMAEALEKEGIKLKDGIKIIHFDSVFWDPSKELL